MFTVDDVCLIVIDVQGKLATIVDESEAMIQDSLARLAKGRTTFTVAHRLSTITDADKIVVIENGQITEMGRHEDLMRKRGAYFELYAIQNLELVE